MNFNSLEKIITKTGIVSLAVLAAIGIIASLFGAMGIDVDLFVGTAIEDIFLFIVLVLSILVSFCLGRFTVQFSFFAEAMNLAKGVSLTVMDASRTFNPSGVFTTTPQCVHFDMVPTLI